MDYKVKTVDEDVINAYINRDIQPVQESFFLKRKEFQPRTEEFDSMFTSEKELNEKKNIYGKGNVKMPNTYFDHIKQIDSTLNFKMKPTTYTESYEYTDKKKEATLHPDDEYHFKKNWYKEYDECKLRHSNVIRKSKGMQMKA